MSHFRWLAVDYYVWTTKALIRRRYLFANECTSDRLKNNIKICIKINIVFKTVTCAFVGE